MSYNTKNYTKQGGDVTVIGGELEFGEGAKFTGAPVVENVVADTGIATKNAAVLNALLLALKKAGVMVGDAWNTSIPTGITFANMPTAATAGNSNKVTTTLGTGNVINVAVGGKVEDELDEADHGAGWGKHYWVGIGIRTGLASDAGVEFLQLDGMEDGQLPMAVTLSADDDSEANSVGLASAGDIILYIKAEVVRDNGGMSFSLSYDGYATTTYKIVIDESDS